MKNLKNIKGMLVLGLTLLTAVPPVLAEVPMSWTQAELSQKAEALYRQGKDQEALEYAEAAFAKDPRDWNALQVAGYASFKLGKKGNAADYCHRSLQVHPQNPDLEAFVVRSFQGTSMESGTPDYLPDLTPIASGLPSQIEPARIDPRLSLPFVPQTGGTDMSSFALANEAFSQARLDARGVGSAGDFMGGFFTGLLAPAVAATGFGFVTSSIGPGEGWGNAGEAFLGGSIGYLAGAIVGTVVVANDREEPRPDLSKVKDRSADYQAFYAQEFRKKGKEKKHHDALAGALVGIGLPIGLLLFTAASSSYGNSY
jgi:tetratricopeptide (TPR) repeat protein